MGHRLDKALWIRAYLWASPAPGLSLEIGQTGFGPLSGPDMAKKYEIPYGPSWSHAEGLVAWASSSGHAYFKSFQPRYSIHNAYKLRNTCHH